MMESREPEEQAPAVGETPDDLRVTALDDSAPSERHVGKRWRWGLRLGGAVALLSLVALAAVTLSPLLAPLLPRLPAYKAPKALEAPPLDITALQIPPEARSCIVGAAWSPDSTDVAIVRDSDCNANSAQDKAMPAALIFDGATGRLKNRFPLDATIPLGGIATNRVSLGGVVWTPDGQRIAVPFTVFPMNGSGATMVGLELLTVRGAQLGEFTGGAGSASSPMPPDPLSQTSPNTVTIWDTQQGSYQMVSVAPAYAYRWRADGSLEPAALPDTPSDTPSIGGDRTLAGGFSLWQRGQLRLVNALGCAVGAPRLLPRPYIGLQLSTLAWSPDGRYLTQVSAAGRYDAPAAQATATPAPPSPFAPCSAGPAPNLLPPAPAHDAGLRSALALASPGVVSVDLEWRPDGQRLAALTFNPSGMGSAIVLYDCRTGAVIHRYAAGQFPINGAPGTGPAKNFNRVFTSGAWSPDGRRLLVEAVGTGAVPFIMGPGALGT